jgi:hypothetical protein
MIARDIVVGEKSVCFTNMLSETNARPSSNDLVIETVSSSYACLIVYDLRYTLAIYGLDGSTDPGHIGWNSKMTLLIPWQIAISNEAIIRIAPCSWRQLRVSK